jgi:hypothetical protein
MWRKRTGCITSGRLARGRQWSGTVAAEGAGQWAQCRYFRGTDTWEAYAAGAVHQKNQQQLLAICSSDSRQVPQYSRGIAEGIGDVWVQRRRGLWRWKMACHHCLGSISETRRHAGVAYQQGALAIRATSCQPQVQFVLCAGSGKDGAVAGILHNVRIGVSWIQRQIGQSHFSCRKDKKGFLNLIRRKGCYLAA